VARATALEMLKEQYGFLKRSIASAIRGNLDEALRIATTLRVLVHETAASKPLLKQVVPNYLQITILDIPAAPLSKAGAQRVFYIGVAVQMNSVTGVRPAVDLTNPPPGQKLVVLGSWWNRELLIFTDKGQRFVFTRKQLILTLANKEGGAHVDTSLPPGYEKFVTESPLRFVVSDVPSDTVHLARYAAVQAAAQMCECLERNFPSVTRAAPLVIRVNLGQRM